MDIVKLEREFGVRLAAGQTCAPGTLINVNSSGQGRVADASDQYTAHGVAFTSGSGTKVAGISQYINCVRNCHVYQPGITLTTGSVVYLGESGAYSTSSGTLAQKVGFALSSDTIFVDIDSSDH